MRSRGRLASCALALLILLVGCASTGSRDGAASPDQNLITRAEIDGTNVADLYEVVQRLRPRWFTIRGSRSFGIETGVVVYQGQTYLGDLNVLKDLGRDVAESLRYLDGPRASATLPGLGSRHVEGAIVIQPRTRS